MPENTDQGDNRRIDEPSHIRPHVTPIDLIKRLDAILASICLSAMILIVLAQIILRNLFNTGIDGADFLVRHLVLWVVFLGASIASRENRHIHIDVLPRFLNTRLKTLSEVLVLTFSVIVLCILCYASIRFVAMEFESGVRLPLLNVPVWTVESIIPAGYGLIAIHYAVQGILGLRDKHRS